MKSGLGIRSELFTPVLEQKPDVGFFEAHSENYFDESAAKARLLQVREHYPISLHGVGLSLGRADDLDPKHLRQLKRLVDEIEPILVSEHLAWSAYSHTHLPDLLPLPLTDHALHVMCDHVQQMQDALGRQVLVENPSNYLLFDQLQIPEAEFLNALAARTGCGLLIDVNNIHVSAANLQRDARSYVDTLDGAAIQQFHLAGYTEVKRNRDDVLIDTHNHPVYPPVWELFAYVLERHGVRPTLIEWDSDFPEFEVLLRECATADKYLAEGADSGSNPPVEVSTASSSGIARNGLADRQQVFLQQVLGLDSEMSAAIEDHRERIWIYQNNSFGAVRDYLEEVYPAVSGVVGAQFFKQMTQVYLQARPPSEGNIFAYGADFAAVLDKFSALQELPYLTDLIDYEWALHHSYFSDTDKALQPDKFTQEDLLVLPVEFNQGVSLLESAYPLYEIHRQSLPDFNGEVAIDLGQSQDSLLVYKREQAVVTRVLDQEERLFFSRLQHSENLLQVIEGLDGSVSPQSLSTMLAMMFEQKLLQQRTPVLH